VMSFATDHPDVAVREVNAHLAAAHSSPR
jgi:hypothetical protein